MGRYTKKQLEEMSDIHFAICILNERLNGLSNPYSPMSAKLRKAIHELEKQDRPKLCNWWKITYTDEDGEPMSADSVSWNEQERIAKLIAEGYSSGQIQNEEDEA